MKESDIRNQGAFDKYLALIETDLDNYFPDKRKFQFAPCVCCGSENSEFQFQKLGFRYILCNDCKTLYVNPRPSYEDLLNFNIKAKSTSFWISDFFLPMAESRRERIFRPRAEFVAQRLNGSALQVVGDIGAGFGLFLEEVKKILPQITAVAIEPSVEMAGICQQKGFQVIHKTIEDIDGMGEKFDCLCAFELLEHLHRPEVVFNKAYEMLKPGGMFLLTALNCEGFDIQLLWGHSKNIYPPQHINFFNPSSLRKILEDKGFSIEEFTTPGRLDWDIVENAIKDAAVGVDRVWVNFAKNASESTKEDFQCFLSRNMLSSHMMVLAKKE